MNHDVHVYMVVRVKVCNVQAATHEEAMTKAEPVARQFAWEQFTYSYLRGANVRVDGPNEVAYSEVDDEPDGYLVDEIDENGELSTYHHYNMRMEAQ